MFELKKTVATLTSVTNRSEKHGEEDVPAVSLGIRITSPNSILDSLSPTLRTTLYIAEPGQKDVPGVEPVTPNLRTEGIEYVAGSGTLEGWTIFVDHGIDDETTVVLKSCKLDKWRVAPKEGGEVEFSFRAGSSNVDPRIMGLLAFKVGQEVTISVRPPKEGAAGSDAASDKAHKRQQEAEKVGGQQRIDAATMKSGESVNVTLASGASATITKVDTPEEAMRRAHGSEARPH